MPKIGQPIKKKKSKPKPSVKNLVFRVRPFAGPELKYGAQMWLMCGTNSKQELLSGNLTVERALEVAEQFKELGVRVVVEEPYTLTVGEVKEPKK